MKNIICFLTFKPSELFYDYVKQLKSEIYDIYICIDDNTYDIPNYKSEDDVKIIKIDNEECENEGFKNTVSYCIHKACSREKALYYFYKNDDIYFDFIWFLEEDVFIPELNTILNIDNKYNDCDLLSRSNIIAYNKNDSMSFSPHWSKVENYSYLSVPYCSSMICAIRCSKKMLNLINKHANNHKTLFHCEMLFNTLAFQNNLSIICPEELSCIIFRNNWKKEDIKKNYLYHPIKDIEKHYEFREYIK